MDFRNYWLDITPKILFQYEITCPECGHELIFIQKDKCTAPYIKYVLEKAHIQNQLNFYKEDNGSIQIDIEIKDNKYCSASKLTDNDSTDNITEKIIKNAVY
jgi:hypothetical protein